MTAKVRLAEVAPWDEGPPSIQGPGVHGASADKPVLYTVPATGERPLRFSAQGLPDGLSLDARTGLISGSAGREGDACVLLRVENRHGKAERELTIAIGRGLALSPPMGWNSWNAWRRWVDDEKTRAAARALVTTGLAARGYTYVNIDSCWQGERGGPQDAIQPNRKFPDMESLVADVHRMGLKFGIYSTPWTVPHGCSAEDAAEGWGGPGLIGCSSGDPDPDYHLDGNRLESGKYVGLNKHEAQDVAQWSAWGVDFLKYDWGPTDPESVARMGRALRQASRDIVFSLCTSVRLEDAAGIKAWANMWRGLPDTSDTWHSVKRNAFLLEDSQEEDWRPHVGPGGWNDLDMLALGPQCDGRGGSRPNRLSEDEQIACMTAWALYPSPLILSCDLTSLSEFELRLFGNEEVIAVNQDALGKPAARLRETRVQPLGVSRLRDSRIWARELTGGRVAVGLFNLGDEADELSVDLGELGLRGPVGARNLWERRDVGEVEDRLSVAVPGHGAQLIQLGK
jgi:alpha-galactosidase